MSHAVPPPRDLRNRSDNKQSVLGSSISSSKLAAEQRRRHLLQGGVLATPPPLVEGGRPGVTHETPFNRTDDRV